MFDTAFVGSLASFGILIVQIVMREVIKNPTTRFSGFSITNACDV